MRSYEARVRVQVLSELRPSLQSGPIQTLGRLKLHFRGGFPAPWTGAQLLPTGHLVSIKGIRRRVSQPSSSSLSKALLYLQMIVHFYNRHME